METYWPDDADDDGDEIDDGPPWLPCEFPERPWTGWTWLCDCEACHAALRAEAAVRPRRFLVLKTGMDRIAVTAEYLSEHLDTGAPAEDLCYARDDYVREIYVAPRFWMLPPERWRSTLAMEDDAIAGRGRVRRRKAARRTAAAERRAQERYAAAIAAAGVDQQPRPPRLTVVRGPV